jgi:hypothetical protein
MSAVAQTSKRRSPWNTIRLVKSLRGEGVLFGPWRGFRRVSYSIDVFALGQLLSGDGDIRGDLSDLVCKAPTNARLRLAGGEEVQLALCAIETEMASIELLAPVPAGLASAGVGVA